ncbi:MAG: hypothetical protein IRZ16_14095 [Myxococcaceae bacterium]|nr:hypothetical protein [Myxococcaceae bacterium]
MATSEERKKSGDAGLERDFGYLMPFFDKVAIRARALPGPAREEVLGLIAGEKERWTRIRSLLLGTAESAPARSASAPSGSARDLIGRPGPTPAASPERVRRGFTVGPLRGQKG